VQLLKVCVQAPFQQFLQKRVSGKSDRDKGPSITDVRTKSRKIEPLPLSEKCPHWLKPPAPLSERTHRKFRKILSFMYQKVRTSVSQETPICPQNSRTGQTLSSLTAGVYYSTHVRMWNGSSTHVRMWNGSSTHVRMDVWPKTYLTVFPLTWIRISILTLL